MRKLAISTIVSGMVLLSGGCTTVSMPEPGAVTAAPVPELGQAVFQQEVGASYALRPSDVVRLNVFREEELSQEATPISADGFISLPLIGRVLASGKTVQELELEVERALGASYLRNPDVTINVVEYASHQVTVEGAVKKPGLYKFMPGTKLSGSIALAEGADRIANFRQVAIFRQTPAGLQVAKFDYLAVQDGSMIDPVLMPGDRIIVGTSGLSQFWQDLLRALPLFAIFTNI